MNRQNAYRYLFPIGCFNGIAGTFLWIAFRMGWLENYPAGDHANLMIGGFLLSFAQGFLWTALPRFLQAPMPEEGELRLLTGILALSSILGILRMPRSFYICTSAALLLTLRFGWRRFHLRRVHPPATLLFVPMGLLGTLFALLLLALPEEANLTPLLLTFARNFYLKGLTLCLILGIGSRLIPALLEHGSLPTEQTASSPIGNLRAILSVSLLILGIFFESSGRVPIAGFLLTLALMLAALGQLKLTRLPAVRSALSWSVWVSCWITCLSPLTLCLLPSYATHFWHMVFISGFGLLTLADRKSTRLNSSH